MPRRQAKWAHPYAIESDYVRALRVLSRFLKQATQTYLVPRLENITALAYRHRADADPIEADANGVPWLTELYSALRRIGQAAASHVQQAYKAAVHFGAQTDDFNSRQFHKVARSSLGVDVFKSEPWLADELHVWEAENLKLITSLPEQHIEKLRGKIVQAVRQGQTTASLKKEIVALYGKLDDRAELIARDQIGKLNGQLTMLRQTGIGVKSYIWHGVLDQRERSSHRAREGREYTWDNGPPDGQNPGLEINCRCWAAAVFPELQGLGVDVIGPSGTAADREQRFKAYAAQPYRTGASFKGPR